jgi:hypothetical protein
MIADKTMTTEQVAERFNTLATEGKWDEIQNELFATDAVSIEPPGAQGLPNAQGMEAIKQKGKQFAESVEEMHGGYSSPPLVAGNYFSVAMGMDVTMKGMGRMKMDEIALYEVKDGKIVREQFFY